jgi:hypothetical protein
VRPLTLFNGAVVAVLTSTALVAVATRPVATAAPSSVPLRWLAAGDSYSSGEGLPHSSGECARAALSSGSSTWAERAYNDIHAGQPNLATPRIVACTGATTNELIDGNDAAGGPEWSPLMGHFDLVTFTFGGNDVGLAPILEQCVGLSRLIAYLKSASTLATGIPRFVAPLASDGGHTCPAASTIERRIAALASTYGAFLTSVAYQVMAPGGNILVLGYPELIELPKFWAVWEQKIGACWGIGTTDATELRGLAGDLNATIGQTVADINKVAPNGVHLRFVDVNSGAEGIPSSNSHLFEPSSGTRHNLCSADSWINGWSPIDYGSGSFHPKQAGLDNEGDLAASAISQLDWSRLEPPADSVSSIIATASKPTATSGIVGQNGTYWFAIAQPAPVANSAAPANTVEVYRWVNGNWTQQAQVQLANKDGTSATGELDPSNRITIHPLTGSGDPDFLIHSTGADTNWLNVVSDATGIWTAVPFNDSGGQTLGEGISGVTGTTITVGYNNCNPDCAGGTITNVGFHYVKGNFAPVDAPGSCTGEALAQAAHSDRLAKGPRQLAQPVSHEIIGFTCAEGYAAAVISTGNYGAIMSFRSTTSGWVVLGLGNLLPPTGLPSNVFPALETQLASNPQNQFFPF